MRCWTKLGAGALAAQLALTAPIAVADEAPWEFRITPVVWAPSFYADTTIVGNSSTSTETDLLDVLDFAVMGSFEARKGPWGLIGEFNYLALSQKASFLGGFLSAKVKLSGYMLGAAATYRLYDDTTTAVDVFAGARYWSLDTKIIFRRIATREASSTLVDPIIGVRGHHALTDKWFFDGLAEIGGFGVGTDFQWEVVGRVGYRFNDNLAVAAGWRHLALDMKDGGLILDATLTGPFMAVDINF